MQLTIDYLFVLTFVFGTIALISQTKLFDADIKGILDVVFAIELWKNTKFKIFMKYMDRLILYYCIMYQVYWWMWYLQ